MPKRAKTCGIYLITNDVPGHEDRFYIGSSVDIERRFRQHLGKHKRKGKRDTWNNFLAINGGSTLQLYVLKLCSERDLDYEEIVTSVTWRHCGFKTWTSCFATRSWKKWRW